MTKILVFGASITYGAWDLEGGWVQRIRKYADEKNIADPNFYCRIYNLGISGDTTTELLKRFECEATPRIREEKDQGIIMFSIGINDSQFINAQKKLRYSKEKYKSNLKELFGLAKKFGSKIIFVGITPVDESKVDPIPWHTDSSYKNQYIEEFNKLAKSVCEEENCDFIDIFNQIKKTDFIKTLEDGVHPNSEGHKLIFEIVKNHLNKKNII